MNKLILLFSLFIFIGFASAQPPKNTTTLNSDQFVNVVEQSLAMYYAEYVQKTGSSYEAVIAELNYDGDQAISFSDEVYCQRLNEMNKNTPFQLECNEATLSTIRFFVAQRRGFARVVLGRSKLYFDMYEAKLAEHGLPLELKYLSVIESGLRPQVKSRAGALGLWQFMYGTGKMFGLKQSSYIDERMDPDLATDAACKYLKQLYGIYNDWNLALAAYNAGPGNVNKAIRRSGNKTTYWEVRPFLPKETQGYVPNFIAASYLLTYHAEHNIIPAEAPIHFYELDTMCLSSGIHMSTINQLIGWNEADIKELNPIYKHSFIPETNPKQCIRGPLKTIGKLVSLEDSLYKLEYAIYHAPKVVPPVVVDTASILDSLGTTANITNPENTPSAATFYHKVRSGETLGTIATTYGTTVNRIMTLNGLRSTNIYVGQRLKIESSKATDGVAEKTPVTPVAVEKKYYTVRSGDNFGKIAQKHGKSISQLRKLNPGVNIDRISVGQKIRVK